MSFHYIPKNIFEIAEEILVFDTTVAIYSYQPEIKLLVISDPKFADSFKQLFISLWEEGMDPKLGFEYTPNHSFYNSLDFFIEGKQLIICPDIDAKKAYQGMDKQAVQDYLTKIYQDNVEYYHTSDYLIGFLWSYQGAKMLDLWKFEPNPVDERSGPLSECRVYRDGVEVKDIGISSGNTLLVLGYEEKLRRSKRSLKEYLEGDPPKLPHELLNGKDFFNAAGKV
jgi:hypothetical protein